MAMTTRNLLGVRLTHMPVRHIGIEEPSRWLIAAWRDFIEAPGVSLAYGAVFVLLGYVIVLGLNNIGLGSLVPAMLAGFFLVAPVLAVGLYQVSAHREKGEPATFEDTILAFRRNLPGLGTMGLILMLAMAAWVQVALLVFMMFFHASPPPLEHFVHGILTADQAIPFLLVGMALGFPIAAVVFAISAVSIPMLLDRGVPVGVAVATSVAAVRENWQVMASWAATIVVLVGLGFATFFVGLAFTLPLLAYATWHAYRAMVV